MSLWTPYIGLPWAAGAQGPQAFDCMSFFRHVQARHFGIEVPAIIAPDYDDPTVLVDLFASHSERAHWSRLESAEHGCAVIVHRPLHIGTWLNVDGGGVLHCVRGAGVIFTHHSAWPLSGFGRRDYFRHHP
jgi:hypothetical protein